MGKKRPSRLGRLAEARSGRASPGKHRIVSKGKPRGVFGSWQGPESGEGPTVQSPLPPYVTVMTEELLSLPVWGLKGKKREIKGKPLLSPC